MEESENELTQSLRASIYIWTDLTEEQKEKELHKQNKQGYLELKS